MIPDETVVAKELVVRQIEASAGVQASGLGGGVNFPPGPTLESFSFNFMPFLNAKWYNLRDFGPWRQSSLDCHARRELDPVDRWRTAIEAFVSAVL